MRKRGSSNLVLDQRRPEDLARDFAARFVEIGHRLTEARALLAPERWLPLLRGNREPATSARTRLDIIDDALCRTADAARCWQLNPNSYNDRRLTRLIEETQHVIATAYPPTEATLRLIQYITPNGLTLGLIECEDCGTPLIAISVDADHTSDWRQAA